MSIDISFIEKVNTLSTFDSPTRIEDFSNEIFYEIFEYMEQPDLFKAFSKLNNRFENLLNYPFLPIKIRLGFTAKTEIQNYYTHFVIPNKHRIRCLHLTDCTNTIIAGSSLNIIDSSCTRLESLILNQVRHNELIAFLPTLTSLPRLLSLIIHFNNNIQDLMEIYRLIFRLSFLKTLKISSRGYVLAMPSSINTSDQYSHIEHLIITHPCNLTELMVLLSNTPLLTHLICRQLGKHGQENLRVMSIKMIHLTKMTLGRCNIPFDQVEIFLEKICQQLRVLSINTSEDVTYLDAYRWERFISKHMPYLHLFKFDYHEWHYQNIELTSYHNLFHQFTSLFWINRGWFFQITADIDYWPPMNIIYSIRTDRKKLDQNAKIKLTMNRLYFNTSRENLANVFFSFISRNCITHLDVDCKRLLYSKFMKLLFILPNLKSLEILSLSSFQLKSLSLEHIELVQTWSKKNQITKLVLNSFMEEKDLEKIQFFIDLCPQMEYLKVKCEGIFNMESIVRFILMKNSDKFLSWNLFCLWVPIATDAMVKQLQAMIHSEKPMDGYRITRTTDRVYLQLESKR